MSVNRGNDPTNKQDDTVFGQSFQQSAGSQQAGAAQPTATASRSIGATGTNRLLALRTGMGRKRPAADLEELKKSFEEEFKGFTNSQAISEAQNFQLFLIDRQRLGKKVDLLVAVLPIQLEGRTHAAVHTLLLEDGNDTYEPASFQIAGQTKRYSTVVGDVYDQDLWGTIMQVVSERSGLQVLCYDAGHQTLPAELDVKDRAAVHTIAFFVTEALTRTALQSILKTTSDIVSLADFGNDIVASATIDFSTVDDQTAAGLPLISEWGVKLRYSDNTRQGEGQARAFDLGSSQPLGGAQGFIDLSYAEPPAVHGYGQQPITQHYWAHVVLTRLDTDQDFITPELQMLSLLGSTLMGRNLNWARVWSQSARGLNPGLKNIGAIGYELRDPMTGNYIGPIDTSTAAFDDAALARLVMQSIHDKPIFEIDVEESGELSWLNRTLLDAAEGSSDAEQSIIATLDNLTNGLFSRKWNGNGHLIVDTGNRIHNGYFVDDEGQRRDIRHLNYLTVLNRFAELDPQLIVKWQETFEGDQDAALRLADREELIRKMLGQTVRITGYSRRLAFAPDLLDVALDAAAEAGLRIRPENTLIGFGQTNVRGRQDLGALAFGGNGGRGVFTAAPQGGTGRGFNRPYTGRGNWR